MRKLTGLFIVAALVSMTWFRFFSGTSHPAAAQTGTPVSSSRSTEAYSQAARRAMQQALAQFRLGNTSAARQLALRASGFNVQWAEGETSPQQLLIQLEGNSTSPRTLDPATTRRQTVPQRAAPRTINPASSIDPRRTPFDPAGRQQRDDDLPSVAADSLSPRGRPAISLTGGEKLPDFTPGTVSNPGSLDARQAALQQFQPRTGTGSAVQDSAVPFTARPSRDPRADGVGAARQSTGRVRGRVDDYMRQAYEALDRGEKQAAIRYASVADVLSGSVNFAPGEETPAAFIARLMSGQNPQPAQPQPAQPQSAQPQSAQPQSAQPQSARPQSAQPQSAQPQKTRPPVGATTADTLPLDAGPAVPAVRSRPTPAFPGPDATRTGVSSNAVTVAPEPSPYVRPRPETTPAAEKLPFESSAQATARKDFLDSEPARRKYALELMQSAREEIETGRLEV
ncbi:MAG: hypothetical protein VB858_06840, partial [Planctomycetaceae bacterium]